VLTPCQRDPQAWDAHRTYDGTTHKATRHDLEVAIWLCGRCPLARQCAELKPEPNNVMAGVLYNSTGKPITIDKFLRSPRPESTLCGDKKGTSAGYRVHEKNGDQVCTPCRDVRNAEKRQEYWAKQTCSHGEPWPAEPDLDALGRRRCPCMRATAQRIPLEGIQREAS
jgi:hypothetical protein